MVLSEFMPLKAYMIKVLTEVIPLLLSVVTHRGFSDVISLQA